MVFMKCLSNPTFATIHSFCHSFRPENSPFEMQLSSVLAIASVATAAAATGLKRELPVTVPVLARAVTGAEYECHASCGVHHFPLTQLSPN
jgi:hypothetical protein